MILSGGMAARAAAVETDADAVGTMIVWRQPVGTGAGNVTPRFRSVMMSPSKDVVQAERHHVVYYCFSRLLEKPGIESGELGEKLRVEN